MALSFGASTAQAAFVTNLEAEMDAIFSQTSFGNRPIDIMWNAVTEIFAPNLLHIDAEAEIGEVFGLGPDPVPTVNFFFVDLIDYCGGFNVNIIGCGQLPGNNFVVESSFAAGQYGGELLAHELGHNLGLFHDPNQCSPAENLMNTCVNGNTDLTVDQVNQIFLSPLVQYDANGNAFIKINPILITDQPIDVVPLPATGLLLAGGLGLLAARRRRRVAA